MLYNINFYLFLFALLTLSVSVVNCGSRTPSHTNNWAVIISTSRFYFNYRHSSNALAIYRVVKRLGIPDDHIVLMLADDMVCDPRNVFPARIFSSREDYQRGRNLYSGDDGTAEVDYRGYEVTTESIIRVLAGRHGLGTPRGKRLLSDENSNVLVYVTGHSAVDTMKVQDADELSAQDIADCFGQMHQQGRYKELLFVADTCHAASIQRYFYSPGILAVSSSGIDEDSYSAVSDVKLGVSMIDRFTRHTLDFLEEGNPKKKTIADLLGSYKYQDILSTVTPRVDLYPRKLKDVPLTDFFGHVPAGVKVSKKRYPLNLAKKLDIENMLL